MDPARVSRLAGPEAALGGSGRGTDEARARARIDSRSRRGRGRRRAALRAAGRARAGCRARRPGRLAASGAALPLLVHLGLGETLSASVAAPEAIVVDLLEALLAQATGGARRRPAPRGRGLAAGGRRSPTTRRCGTTAAAGCGPAGPACVQALVLELDPAERRELAGDGSEVEVYSRLFHGRAASERRFAVDRRAPRARRVLSTTDTATAIAERATPRPPSCWRWPASSGCASAAARCRGRSSFAPRAGWRTPRSTCGRWPPRATSRSSKRCARPS